MPSWNWSMQPLGLKEFVPLNVGVILLLEGPNYYSDLLRGIAVGLLVSLLWQLLAERRGLYAAICASFVLQAMRMSPYQPGEGQGATGHVIAMHFISALLVLPLVWFVWYRHRLARGVAQAPQG
jgi:hypothetical protein